MQLNFAQVGASPVGSRTWGKAMACAPGLSNTMLIDWKRRNRGASQKGLLNRWGIIGKGNSGARGATQMDKVQQGSLVNGLH